MTKTTEAHKAINWMIEKSEVVFDSTDEFDGEMIHATTGEFSGKLPSRMGSDIREWLQQNATMRDTRSFAVYNLNVGDLEVTIKYGGKKSTLNNMTLIWNRYEVVAS